MEEVSTPVSVEEQPMSPPSTLAGGSKDNLQAISRHFEYNPVCCARLGLLCDLHPVFSKTAFVLG